MGWREVYWKKRTHTLLVKAVNTWKESLAALLNLLEDPLEWHGILFWGSLPENSPGFRRVSMDKIVPFLSPHKTVFSCNTKKKRNILKTQCQKLHLPGCIRNVTDDSRGCLSFPIVTKVHQVSTLLQMKDKFEELGIYYIHVHVYHKSKNWKNPTVQFSMNT